MQLQPLRTLLVKVARSKILTLYSPTPAPGAMESHHLENMAPSRFIVQHQLDRMPRDQLNWSFETYKCVSKLPLSVERNRLKRRWNEGMRMALKENGFDHRGRRIQTTSTREEPQSLTGTLSVLLYNGYGVDESIAELKDVADHIVKAVIQQHRRQPRAQTVSTMKSGRTHAEQASRSPIRFTKTRT